MSKPKITPLENGPYLIEGTDAVVRYTDGKTFPIQGTAALCRCGGSKNKPFCNGSHKSNGFTSAKDPNRVPDELEDYSGDGITIHDNRGLCAHAGRCTDGLPVVFRLGKEPWIAASGADAETIAGDDSAVSFGSAVLQHQRQAVSRSRWKRSRRSRSERTLCRSRRGGTGQHRAQPGRHQRPHDALSLRGVAEQAVLQRGPLERPVR